MSGIAISTNNWPVVIINFAGYQSTKDADAFAYSLQELGGRGRFAAIGLIDGLKAGAKDRNYMVEAISDLQNQFYLSEAVVASSSVMRGFYTAYIWIRGKRRYPSKVFSRISEAMEWSRMQLEQQKIAC